MMMTMMVMMVMMVRLWLLLLLLMQECPSGVVNEDTFKYIYAQFFPQGGKSLIISSLVRDFYIHNNYSYAG